MEYAFYVSYARAIDGPYLSKFVDDLSEDVRIKLGRGRDEKVAFFDRHDIELASNWESTVQDALQRSAALLALMSPAYFLSEHCGKEWEIFQRRATIDGRTSIVPVLWSPIDLSKLPDDVARLQLFASDAGAVYRERGVSFLLKGKFAREYIDVVDRLSSHIVALAGQEWNTDRALPAKSEIPSAFSRKPSAPPVRLPPAASLRPTSGRLFLCYRREDTQDAAGRLHDHLTAAFGEDRVFMDIDSTPLGIDFVDHVVEEIAKCNAVIVLIGKQWLKAKDKKRRRRIDNEDDLVRVEIHAALQQKIAVIPVVVQGASVPAADDLPENIRALARRNGIELSATRWNTDVEQLTKELRRLL